MSRWPPPSPRPRLRGSRNPRPTGGGRPPADRPWELRRRHFAARHAARLLRPQPVCGARIDGIDASAALALRECHGLQCGFCTTGFVTSLTALLRDNPNPTEDEIRQGLSGNFCRCTGYQGIVAAAHRAADVTRAAQR